MPIFEYHCESCGNDFEALVKSAGDKPNCVKCDSGKVGKKLSVFSASVASPAKNCAMQGSCPSAGGHACGGGCCHGMPQ